MLVTPWTRFAGDGLHGRYPVVTEVLVDLGTLFSWPPNTPRRVAASGLSMSGVVRGQLHGRLQDVDGRWYGVCDFDLPYADGRRATIRCIDQVVPFRALSVPAERVQRGT
ncbi:hypothetical protein [Actinokineospora iranica]|uniref:Uncharacterized protein n=1 Tax=Actinokineospora iranica TaxID=1271860 RepID=A0A1G6WRX9_9PSEU|nr:hypothetical protein [Actinokineospora iranica]SDD68700.1 hypothetical protein SAMN05216174_115147 [Actinokineospora iranica]